MIGQHYILQGSVVAKMYSCDSYRVAVAGSCDARKAYFMNMDALKITYVLVTVRPVDSGKVPH